MPKLVTDADPAENNHNQINRMDSSPTPATHVQKPNGRDCMVVSPGPSTAELQTTLFSGDPIAMNVDPVAMGADPVAMDAVPTTPSLPLAVKALNGASAEALLALAGIFKNSNDTDLGTVPFRGQLFAKRSS